ncbi:hypothetical protein L1049_013333 [Liquidambar formosana]|uniref:Uncharacterized protein n=1 Tax=Liquidambar formosana TaxID=63359 RepID=A0AAP0WXZ5_LIQFO
MLEHQNRSCSHSISMEQETFMKEFDGCRLRYVDSSMGVGCKSVSRCQIFLVSKDFELCRTIRREYPHPCHMCPTRVLDILQQSEKFLYLTRFIFTVDLTEGKAYQSNDGIPNLVAKTLREVWGNQVLSDNSFATIMYWEDEKIEISSFRSR